MAMCQAEFVSEHSDDHWLGNGLYFFQDAPYRAWEWTETYLPGRKKVQAETAVVRAVIEVNKRELIDLLDIQWMEVIKREYQYQLKAYKEIQNSAPKQQSIMSQLQTKNKVISAPHRLDCDIIDSTVRLLKSRGLNIRATRAAFIEGEALFKNAHLYDRAHVQIVVHDYSIIKQCRLEQRTRF